MYSKSLPGDMIQGNSSSSDQRTRAMFWPYCVGTSPGYDNKSIPSNILRTGWSS